MNIEQFHFIRPYWLLAFIPLLYLLWMVVKRQRVSGNWQAVCDPRLIPHILMGIDKSKNYWTSLVVGIVGALAIISIAGPSWQQLPQPVFRTQSSLVIVLDLSRSMDAQDTKPSRLVRARHKVLDILKRRNEGQTALIAYAREAFTVTPLTDDTHTIAALVNTLSTDMMPSQGSNASSALQHAQELLINAGSRHGHILLVTDGVEDSDINAVIDTLTGNGYRLSILGVGTEAGAPIPSGSGGFVTDKSNKGEIVIPKLNEPVLRQLAARGGGQFQVLRSDDVDVNTLMGAIETQQLKQARTNTNQQTSNNQLKLQADIWREEGPWLLLLIVPFIALVFRRGALAVLFITLLPIPNTSQAFEWQDLWKTPDQQALQAFEHGDHKKAATLFQNQEWQAAAQYRAKDYEAAVKSLDGLHTPESLYNKANALAKLGDLEQAINNYDEALSLDPEHKDAKYNRDLLKKLLENKQEQKQDSQQQQQGDGKQQSQQQNGSGQDQQENSQQNSTDKQADQSKYKDSATQNSSNEQQNESNEQQNNQNDKGSEQAAKDQQKELDPEKGKQLAQQQQQQSKNEDNVDKDHPSKSTLSPVDKEQREKQIANEQWLRQIPDDPGGLLRRKFLYQSQIEQDTHRGDEKPW